MTVTLSSSTAATMVCIPVDSVLGQCLMRFLHKVAMSFRSFSPRPPNFSINILHPTRTQFLGPPPKEDLFFLHGEVLDRNWTPGDSVMPPGLWQVAMDVLKLLVSSPSLSIPIIGAHILDPWSRSGHKASPIPDPSIPPADSVRIEVIPEPETDPLGLMFGFVNLIFHGLKVFYLCLHEMPEDGELDENPRNSPVLGVQLGPYRSFSQAHCEPRSLDFPTLEDSQRSSIPHCHPRC